ncbi:MAG: glycosyltransferase family 4 protein [Planctomycetota bacterium]
MDVVALVPDRDHVSARYRIGQYSRHLRNVGLNLALEPLAKGTADRFLQVTRPRPHQIVFLQRKLLPVWQVALLRQTSRMLIYDFDDAVHLRDSFHPRGPYSLTRAIRFRATVSLADFVIAGNSFLADVVRACTNSRKIHVIPTCVDPSRYPLANHLDHRPTRLVWIGSSSTLRSLEEGRSLLELIGRKVPSTTLRVICDRFPDFEHLSVEPAVWSPETEVDDLRGSDIGISFLSDNSWSRGKCGLKVLQYMAAALPVVASPVGVHAQMVDQEHGFLPTTTGDWVESIQELSRDAAMRAQMGREGRMRVERQFHVDTWGPILAEKLAEAAARL